MALISLTPHTSSSTPRKLLPGVLLLEDWYVPTGYQARRYLMTKTRSCLADVAPSRGIPPIRSLRETPRAAETLMLLPRVWARVQSILANRVPEMHTEPTVQALRNTRTEAADVFRYRAVPTAVAVTAILP